MVPVTFGESHNGYPLVDVSAPYELFGEFLRSASSLRRAREIVAAIDTILGGGAEQEEIWQDYARLTLDQRLASVWFDNLSKGIEETSTMPISLFREIALKWLTFLESRAQGRPEKGGPEKGTT